MSLKENLDVNIDIKKSAETGAEIKSAAICTLGCKVNQYESDVVSNMLIKSGYQMVDFAEKADVYIINTCTVTSLSDKKSRQMIRRAIKQNPNAVVAAMGCYVQVSHDEVAKIDGLDVLVGNEGKKEIVSIIEQVRQQKISRYESDFLMSDKYEHMETILSSDRTRAFIKIQDGCNQFCSYCLIPYARGRIRSRELDDIIIEVKQLAEDGFSEVVLTGIHVASYGMEKVTPGSRADSSADEGEQANNPRHTLIDVIEAVHEVPGIKRIRLGSLEPGVVTEDFVERLSKLDKFCPQFHLSLQSGSDPVLKRMNRKYTSAEYFSAVELLKSKLAGATFTTDVIVGFPGESEDNFNESVDFSKKVGFMKIHVFPYSPRKGTVAAKYEDSVEPQVKSQRAAKLIEVSNQLQEQHNRELVGSTLEVLFEQEVVLEETLESAVEKLQAIEGHTRGMEKIIVPNGDLALLGQYSNVKIIDAKTEYCIGEVVETV